MRRPPNAGFPNGASDERQLHVVVGIRQPGDPPGKARLAHTHGVNVLWQPWGDLTAAAGLPLCGGLACAGSLAGRLLVAVTADADLFYTIRNPDGSWVPPTGWHDVSPISIAATAAPGGFHLAMVDVDGRPWHTIVGMQAELGDIFGQVGDRGAISTVAAATATAGCY